MTNTTIYRCDRTLPFRYYTRDRLVSWEARTKWAEPDLRAIELVEVPLKSLI